MKRRVARRLMNSRVWGATARLRDSFMPIRRRLPRSIKNRLTGFAHASQETQIPWLTTSSEQWESDRPLLSVIIPCHNYGLHLAEALKSVQAETYQGFEVIIVDDRSTDVETLQILQQLRDQGLKVIRLDDADATLERAWYTPAQARNTGIAEARGKYICCLDADDTIEPTYFEKCLCMLESNPGISFAYSEVRLFGDEAGLLKTRPFDLRLLLEYNHLGPTGSVIFKKSCWQLGGFDSSIRGYEDWDFWIRLGKAGFRGRLITEPLYNWRRHGMTFGRELEMDHRGLSAQIRIIHADLYSDPKRIESIEREYRNLKTPQPFLNLNRRSQYLASNEERKAVLVVASWHTPSATQFLYELLKNWKTQKTVDFIIIATNRISNSLREKLYELSKQVYPLANFLDDYCWRDFVRNILIIRSVKTLLISESTPAYEWCTRLQLQNLHVVDILHDESWADYVELSAKLDPFITHHFTLSPKAESSLRDHGISAEKIRLTAKPGTSEVENRFAEFLEMIS